MALKASIHYAVPPQAVAAHAPREFREFVHLDRLKLPAYTVISYPGMRSEAQSIVTSKAVAKALAHTAAHGEPLVVIAHGFTAEALEILETRSAVVFRRSDFYWSDASYASIRP